MISPRSLVCLLAFAAITAAGPALAQLPGNQPRITFQLSARSIGVGDQAVLAYLISGGTQQGIEDYPQEIHIPDLTITYAGSRRRMANINGVSDSVMEVRYTVRSEKTGTFTIPEQVFKVDGQDIKAPAVTVEVKEGPAIAEELAPTAQLSIGKTEMWKGEVIPLQVGVLIHPSVQPAGPLNCQLKSLGFAVRRFDRSAGVHQRMINGEPWNVWQVESVMTPLQPGVQTFGPAEVGLDVYMPLSGGVPRDPFGSMGSSATRKSLKINTNSLEINVRDWPAEDRPEGFNGAVGNFDILITATPTTLKVGEPIAVEIAISGTGNFDSVQPPPMATKAGWRTYDPRVAQENRGFGTEAGSRSYTQILIPEKNLTEIPSFVLNYFDPSSGTYVTKKSAPVALTVTGDAPPPPSVSEMKDFNASSEAAIPGEELNDILSKPLTGGRWISTAALPIPTSPYLLHGVPAAFLALVLGSGIARRLRAAAAARRPASDAPRAPSEILSELRRFSGSRRAFHTLVQSYLESVQFQTGGQALPDSPEFRALLAARDRCLYGPATPETEAPLPAEERKSVLSLLPPVPPSA